MKVGITVVLSWGYRMLMNKRDPWIVKPCAPRLANPMAAQRMPVQYHKRNAVRSPVMQMGSDIRRPKTDCQSDHVSKYPNTGGDMLCKLCRNNYDEE